MNCHSLSTEYKFYYLNSPVLNQSLLASQRRGSNALKNAFQYMDYAKNMKVQSSIGR